MNRRPLWAPSAPATWALTALLAGAIIGAGHHAIAQSQSPSQQQRHQSPPLSSQQQGNVRVSSMAINGGSGTEALRLERKDPVQIRAGQPFEYQIVVTNTSDTPVHEVVVREKNPGGMQIDQASPKRAPESSSNENIWRLGTLKPGESQTVTVNATPPSQGQMQTCLTVDFKPTLCTQFQVVKPNLKLERMIVDAEGNLRDRLLACEDVFVLYRLTNAGTGMTQEARIEEELDGFLRTADGKSAITLVAGRLDAGEVYEQRIPLEVSQQQTGRYSGVATATTGELRARSSTSTVAIVKPNLKLTVDGPQREFINRPVSYDVHVENTGDGPALDTQVAVDLPARVDRVTWSGQDIERNGNAFIIGRLDPGESRDFSFTFDVTEPTQLTTQAAARAYCAASQQAQVATMIAGIPAVRLEVVDLKDPVQVGDITTYEIRVKNQGSADDLNVSVQGQLPSEMQFVDARGDTSVKSQGQTVQFGKIDKLAPGEMASWYVQAKADKAGRVAFELQLTSDINQQPISEQEPTTLY